MKLIIDGRPFTKPISGIGQVLSNTISSSSMDLSGIKYNVACPNKLSKDYQNFQNVSHVYPSSILKWYSFKLGHLTRTTGADILWGCSHRLPLYYSGNYIPVLSVHDLVWKKYPKTMTSKSFIAEKLLFGHSVKLSQSIICVSHSTANDLIQFFPNAENKINVIYPGVAKARIKPTQPEKPFILFVGTIEPRKNLLKLIEAYSDLSISIRNNIDLVIAGGQGWRQNNLEGYIKHIGLEHQIKLMLSPNNTILESLYAQCQFLVLPSLYEGFGIPLAEAMQYGKPVITSNSSSMAEVAGDAGLIVDSNNVGELKEAITEFICNSKLLQDMGEKAIVRSSLFDREKSAEKIINLFSSL